MFTLDRSIDSVANGKLFTFRLLLQGRGLDLGDVFSTFVAHFRTWDFKAGDKLASAEQSDYESLRETLVEDGFVDPSTFSLKQRKITASIDPVGGTSGRFVVGPREQRPGPFGWNSLTSEGVAKASIVAVSIKWDDNMGFGASTPDSIVSQHKGCDDDARFYNNMVVLHNKVTGQRRYWKLKGKTPETLYIDTLNDGPVTLHVLMVPTPPTDYATDENAEAFPIPIYSYQYKVDILSTVPSGETVTPASDMEYGIVKFDNSNSWWPSRCTCVGGADECLEPTFAA